jgi:hypothetical protein
MKHIPVIDFAEQNDVTASAVISHMAALNIPVQKIRAKTRGCVSARLVRALPANMAGKLRAALQAGSTDADIVTIEDLSKITGLSNIRVGKILRAVGIKKIFLPISRNKKVRAILRADKEKAMQALREEMPANGRAEQYLAIKDKPPPLNPGDRLLRCRNNTWTKQNARGRWLWNGEEWRKIRTQKRVASYDTSD